jgi:hypothetical protein
MAVFDFKQVANLARDIQQSGINLADFAIAISSDNFVDPNQVSARKSSLDRAGDPAAGVFDGIDFNTSQTLRIGELLGTWEEPEIAHEHDVRARFA